jgi:adenylate kinase family enzyme
MDYYERRGVLRTIDGNGTPDEVFERVQRAVDLAAT